MSRRLEVDSVSLIADVSGYSLILFYSEIIQINQSVFNKTSNKGT